MTQLAHTVALETLSVEAVPQNHMGRDSQTRVVALQSIFKGVLMDLSALHQKDLQSPFMREHCLLRSLNTNFHRVLCKQHHTQVAKDPSLKLGQAVLVFPVCWMGELKLCSI